MGAASVYPIWRVGLMRCAKLLATLSQPHGKIG